jgi:hypothetical protein
VAARRGSAAARVLGLRVRIPQRIFSSSNYRPPLEPTQLHAEWTLALILRGQSGRYVKLTNNLHLVPNLRMSGMITLLRLYTFMAWAETLCLFVLCDFLIECDLEGNGRGPLEVQSRYFIEGTEENYKSLRIAGNWAKIRIRHLLSTSLGLLALHESDCLTKHYHLDLFACHSVEPNTSSEVKNHVVERYFHGTRKSVTVFRKAHCRSVF